MSLFAMDSSLRVLGLVPMDGKILAGNNFRVFPLNGSLYLSWDNAVGSPKTSSSAAAIAQSLSELTFRLDGATVRAHWKAVGAPLLNLRNGGFLLHGAQLHVITWATQLKVINVDDKEQAQLMVKVA